MIRRPTESDQDSLGEDQGESFLGRWSRRKQEVAKHDIDEEIVDHVSPGNEEESPTPSETSESDEEQPVLTDEDMPDIETITGDSDVSAFLSPGVSEALRNRALKKMFVTSAFNIRDGLDEYDDDFTTFEKLGDIVTADMKHQMEVEAEKLKRKAEEMAKLEEANPELVDAEQGDVNEDDSPANNDPNKEESGIQTELAQNQSVDDETDPPVTLADDDMDDTNEENSDPNQISQV